jgi:hypothetical protein
VRATEELRDGGANELVSGITPAGLGGKYGWDIMRLEALGDPRQRAARQPLTGQESWDRREVVTAFTNFKKWQDKKWLPDEARSRSL